MELDLPTGTDSSGGGDHLAKFLSTLTELVDLLGKTGPGGASGGAPPTGGAADSTGGKNLIKATQKLFTDLANAFKPLKTVLSKFGTITPAAAKAEPAPAPIALEAPAPEVQADEAKPKRKSRKKKANADEAGQGQGSTPLAALTIQDASIGIDYASVKMPAPPAKAKPKPEPEKEPEPLLAKLVDIDTNLVKITVPTASFKITSALLQGKFFMPPEAADAKPAPEAKPETAPKPKPEADEAPAKKPEKPEKPEKPAAQKTPKATTQEKPKKANGESAIAMLTWGNVFKRLIGGADERKNKIATKGKDKPEKETEEKADDTQEKNTSAKEAAKSLQNAIINIANGTVHVITGEKKEEKKDDEKENDNNSDAAKDFAQKQADLVKGEGGKGGGKSGPKAMPKVGTGPKITPMPAAGGAGGAGGGGPKMGDPRAMVLLAVAKVATSLKDGAVALGQAAIAAAHKVVDGAQKGAQLVGSGVAAPFKEMSQKMFGGSEMLMKAFTDPVGAFKDLSGLMISFVQVVNPAAVMHFTKAMTDVTAIIGRALVPAMNIATEVVRELGDVMAPLYEQMTPFVTMIARAFGDMFISMIRVSFMFAQVFLPIAKTLYIALAGLARIVTAVLEGLVILVSGFLGTFDGLDNVVQSVVDAIVTFTQWVVKGAVSLAVLVAKMLGATQFIANMKNTAKNNGATARADSTGMAAPTGGQFQSAEGFGKSIAQASFTATSGGAAPKKTDDFLAEIGESIDAMAQIDLKQIIIDAIVGAAKATVTETAKGVATVAYEGSGMGVVNRTGAALGEWVGGMLFG